MDAFGKNESNQANRPAGLIYQSEDRQITIWAKTWSEVLHSNRQRLRLFQSCLEINADNDRSLQFLKDTYASVLGSVEESEEVVTAEVSAALAVNEQVV
jgi:hypothetical protein